VSLLDTHIGFVEALRAAGLSVSLAEGLDAIGALEQVSRGFVRTTDGKARRQGHGAQIVVGRPPPQGA